MNHVTPNHRRLIRRLPNNLHLGILTVSGGATLELKARITLPTGTKIGGVGVTRGKSKDICILRNVLHSQKKPNQLDVLLCVIVM